MTAWEALATQRETTMEELPVVFEDVSIVQAVQANPGDAVTLSVLLDRSHRFQVRCARIAAAGGALSSPVQPCAGCSGSCWAGSTEEGSCQADRMHMCCVGLATWLRRCLHGDNTKNVR